ncbi:MAG: winged helix-turn-helix domain-containing protein [Bdellovibrionaceae bacterium]|nr:winged helix-turn-helix domain-containing protein [Pseudobdellovibrionaceae bacterium]
MEEDFSKAVYFNSAYAGGFGTNEASVLKNENHIALVDGWRMNQNRSLGTLRFVPDDEGEILMFEALNSEIKISSDSFHILLLIPITSREKMHKTKPRESYIFDDMRVSIPNQLAKVRGKLVNFSATEFKLFSFLCRHEDQLLSKEELLKQVWGKSAQNTRTVDIYVSRIKKRLKEAGSKRDYIKTMHGRGYIFQITT